MLRLSLDYKEDYDLAKNCELVTTKLDHDSKKILNRVSDNKFY